MEWYGDRCEILNSWHGREGKIGGVHGPRYRIPWTVAVSRTTSVAWIVMALEDHLQQKILEQHSLTCWECRELCIQVSRLGG